MANVVLMMVLLGIFALISAVDIRRRVICVFHLLVLLVLRIACAFATAFVPGCLAVGSLGGGFTALLQSCFAAAIVAVAMYLLGAAVSKLTGKESLGFGDVLLLGACSTFLRPSQLEAYFLLVAVFGMVVAIASALAKKRTFPFAPVLVVPCWAVLFCSI